MANGKVLLLLGVLFAVAGSFGVTTSLWEMKSASLNGVTELTGFQVGTAGGGLLFLAGIVMLVWLWPKIVIKP